MISLIRFRIFTAFFISAVASGCDIPPKKPNPPVLVESKKTVEIDRRLLADCPDLPKLTDSTDETSIKVTKEWLNAYNTCRTNKSKLNAVVKDAFNLKEKK
jgi:hypothetical protein